jgi:hypothetical protein
MTEKLEIAKKRTQGAQEILADIINLQVSVTDEKVRDGVIGFYENQYKSRVFTIDERVTIMSAMGQYREAFAWFIGDQAMDLDDKIMRGELQDYRSLNAFFDKHEDEIGMSRSSWYDCYTVRRRFPDFYEFANIGIKKAKLLNTIKDDEVFTKMANQVAKKDMPAEKVRDMVADYHTQEQETKKEERKKEQKKVSRTVAYDAVTKGESIVLKPKNFDVQYLQGALAYYETAMKNYIKKCIDNE